MSVSARLAWGILGTGNIAEQFAEGLTGSERGRLVAVGSRRMDSAEAFVKQHRGGKAYGNYDGVLGDPAVEAVYNSLPNSMHHEWTIKALRAGKHVLCEKPMGVNLREVEEMFGEARRAKRVLAEAFMYRSHPLTLAVERAVREGVIGKVRIIRTSFVYASTKIAGNIRFDAALAGGSIMDIGCYCLSYSRLFAGAEPTSMKVYGHVHESGIDDFAAGAMAFPGDIVANFSCGMTVHADNTAEILGTEGYIEVPVPWKPPVHDAAYSVVDAGGRRQTHLVSAGKHLYALEADDFAATVQDGMPQRVSVEDSLANQRWLDEMRRQVGLSF
jgi:D-xylose 1-dehydrogenase (NADP+, D-xylono-1,5-lactone-forming)